MITRRRLTLAAAAFAATTASLPAVAADNAFFKTFDVKASRLAVAATCKDKGDLTSGTNNSSGSYFCIKANDKGFIACDANGDCTMGVPAQRVVSRQGQVTSRGNRALPPSR